ncbi:Uma2 family endonuclease [Pannus brasiliensis CCIBt3594]|uniref:Uma2 family endonuclease n=1 Tax=Pannus brasiliensis CCIBt3594 TaxID=1427578 RepID=A0AAW9QWA7_9CHRO
MVTSVDRTPATEIVYPDSDGKPLVDNTRQFRWITTIQSNLDRLFADDPDVFVAGDLLWYPVEGDNKTRQAPDVMVAFGRPKGERGSYQQWQEGGIPPRVVFEILSPGNKRAEMAKKFLFYDRHGVEEYYIYDPDRNDLEAYIRGENRLEPIENFDNRIGPALGIRFPRVEPRLIPCYPDGQPFTGYNEERERAEAERQRAERLVAKPRELNIDPDEVWRSIPLSRSL